MVEGVFGATGSCWNFRDSQDGAPYRMTAIVVPVRFSGDKHGATQVAWACSLGRTCFARACLYALAYRTAGEAPGANSPGKVAKEAR